MTARTGLVALALAACGLPKPYSPAMLAEDARRIPEKALVHYLSQAPPVPVDVCDPTSAGAHVPVVDERLIDALDAAYARDRIPAAHWAGCLGAMWRGVEPALRERVARDLLGAFPDALEDHDRPANESLLRLESALSAIGHRPADARLPEDAAAAALARVEAALPDLADTHRALAERFAAEVGLDLGRWGGALVDAARVAGEVDEELLARFAARLPDPDLRAAARERIVRLRVARGPWPEARAHEEEVVRAVLDTGRWALDPARFPPRAVRATAEGPAGLVVVQDVRRRDADLRARTAEGALVGEIDLAPLLALEVEGIAAPVALCPGAGGLDPTPCVDPAALTSSLSLVAVTEGRVTLPTALPGATTAALARLERLEVPIAVGEATATLSWPLAFAPPAPLVLTGQGLGSPGPGLVVRVRTEANGRFVFDVTAEGTSHVVVVESGDLGGFRVASQGAQGQPGSDGTPGRVGTRGTDGLDAVCPYTRGTNGSYGGNGGPGGPGGAGGPGGDGGGVAVFLKCSPEATCRALLDRVEPAIASVGGPGGAGGKGGEGGQGGEGGEGGEAASCTHLGGPHYVEGGHDGPDGLRGDDGPDGPPGTEGRPGEITFTFVP